MDTNRRPTQICEPPMDSGDWRSHVHLEGRKRVIEKICHNLKRLLPASEQGEEALLELKRIAMRYEERMFTTAISQYDYLKKIALKMLRISRETPMLNNGQNPSDPGSGSTPSHLNSQVPPIPVPLPTNLPQSQMTQPQTSQTFGNPMNHEIYNPSTSQPWVSNAQQSTTNNMDPVEELAELFNKIL